MCFASRVQKHQAVPPTCVRMWPVHASALHDVSTLDKTSRAQEVINYFVASKIIKRRRECKLKSKNNRLFVMATF